MAYQATPDRSFDNSSSDRRTHNDVVSNQPRVQLNADDHLIALKCNSTGSKDKELNQRMGKRKEGIVGEILERRR